MKSLPLMVAVVAAGALLLFGCRKSGVDTGKLESSFRSAEAAAKKDVDAAVAAIKAGNYTEALAKLQAAAAHAKLTPEQQRAIQDVVEQLKKQLAAKAEQIKKEAGKALGDLQKSLPK
ncbi:MAG: hypothetical protein N3B01_02840 [Verrucomicrobiae bacterium]|nr:hypothetical protein [Verrucomicrobiae bacterium]